MVNLMQKPKALVLVGYGINCDRETKTAFEKAGAVAERVHINDLISGDANIGEYQIFFIPGGFSFGDELSAGKVLANKLRLKLGETLLDFIEDGNLVGGHCNGAQVLVKAGLVPALNGDYTKQTMTLANNDSGRYEDRWVRVKNASQKCVWTADMLAMHVPVAHGEGKFFSSDPTIVDKLKENDQIALVYVDEEGKPANGRFPYNPNGSVADIAGICDHTGRVFAQMPHPERYLSLTNKPNWTRAVRAALREGFTFDQISWEGRGVEIFKNAVDYAVGQLV
jgi:phosphoribosylformylglycinamidine synthase